MIPLLVAVIPEHHVVSLENLRKVKAMSFFSASLWVALVLIQDAATQKPLDIFAAIRSGNLPAVKQFLREGVDKNGPDRYGITPIGVAAQVGNLEIAKYLVAQKVDLNRKDHFYNLTPLIQALSNQHLEVGELLLAHGAEPREDALEFAVSQGKIALVRAAQKGGPIHESRLAGLKKQDVSAELKVLLESFTTRPDPPKPAYTAKDLTKFVGNFEGFDSDTKGKVRVVEGALQVSLNTEPPMALVATAENTFTSSDGNTQIVFTGRAGSIEGFLVIREGNPPDLLRHSVAEPVSRPAVNVEEPPKMFTAEANRTDQWPGFRGANGTGIVEGKEVPLEWDLEQKKNIRWISQLQGLGNSSPVIWGNTLVITTAVGEGVSQSLRVGSTGDGSTIEDKVIHSWRVLAYDKTTGKQLWEREVGKAQPMTQRHFKATQANSTPATDGTHIVAVFPTAGLACLDFSGTILWHHDLGGLNASAFYSPETQWGFAASPIIYKDTVILQVDIYGEPYIAAWDLRTGAQRWKTPRQVATSWSTPAIFPTAQGDELVVNGSSIIGYAPDSGKELWSLGPNSELVIAMPVVGPDVVFVSAGYPPVKPIYAIRAGLRGAFQVKPGDAHQHLLWSEDRGGAYLPTPLLYNGYYFVVHHNGRLVVYQAATGVAIHKSRFSQRGTFTASPIVVNGKIYTGTEEGIMYILEGMPGFKELAAHDFDEPLMATPAVSSGVLYVRTPSRLIAIGAAPQP